MPGATAARYFFALSETHDGGHFVLAIAYVSTATTRKIASKTK